MKPETSPYTRNPSPNTAFPALNNQQPAPYIVECPRLIRRGVSNRCCTGPGQYSHAWGWAAPRTRPRTTVRTTSFSNAPIGQARPPEAAAPPCPRQQGVRGYPPASGQAQVARGCPGAFLRRAHPEALLRRAHPRGDPPPRPRRVCPRHSRVFSLFVTSLVSSIPRQENQCHDR